MIPRPLPSLVSLVLALVVAGAVLAGAPSPSSAAPTAARVADRDCGDFATQAAAQRFYVAQGGPRSDPHGLDSDGDGVACESNPCPCSTATGGGTSGGGPGSGLPARLTERGRIVKVVDGDTVDVRLTGGREIRVRMIGIDTPEVYGGRECWGAQASRATKRMLPVDTRVVLTSDRTQSRRDRYGRSLRYVRKLSSRVDVNRWLVRNGHARVYVYGGVPFERVRPYRADQSRASRHDRGLWGRCR